MQPEHEIIAKIERILDRLERGEDVRGWSEILRRIRIRLLGVKVEILDPETGDKFVVYVEPSEPLELLISRFTGL